MGSQQPRVFSHLEKEGVHGKGGETAPGSYGRSVSNHSTRLKNTMGFWETFHKSVLFEVPDFTHQCSFVGGTCNTSHPSGHCSHFTGKSFEPCLKQQLHGTPACPQHCSSTQQPH